MKNTNIITVASNKGGVGKTSVSVCTGIYFSQIISEPTLILELDSSPGDFMTLFDIDPGKTLKTALRFPSKFKKYVKKISNDLYVMGGIIDPILAEAAGREEFYGLLDEACREYKNIIIDTQTVLNGLMVDAFLISKKIFMVTDFSMESIGRIVNFFNILTKNFSIPEDRIELVINKKKFFDFLKIWDLIKMTEIPVCALISFDRRFDKSFFITNIHKLKRTRFFNQLKRMLENEFKKQDTGD